MTPMEELIVQTVWVVGMVLLMWACRKPPVIHVKFKDPVKPHETLEQRFQRCFEMVRKKQEGRDENGKFTTKGNR